MFSTYRRHGLVLILLALAGFSGGAVSTAGGVPPLPAVSALIAHNGWAIDQRESQPICTAAHPGFNTAVCVVRNRQGVPVQLYVGVRNIQVVHWSGELGFEGGGYQTSQRGVTTVRLRDGRVVPASVSIEQRLGDRELEEYAVVSPAYIAAHSTDHLVRDAWDVVRGHSGPYFVVRVAVSSPVAATDQRARTLAAQLLSPVLSYLSVAARERR